MTRESFKKNKKAVKLLKVLVAGSLVLGSLSFGAIKASSANELEKEKFAIEEVNKDLKDENNLLTNEKDVLKKDHEKLQGDFGKAKKDSKKKITDLEEEVKVLNSKLEVPVPVVVEEEQEVQSEQEPVVEESVDVASNTETSHKELQQEPSGQSSGRTLTVQATAYDGVSLGGVTATGNMITSTGHKVIAVDPSVIPLGSIVEVPGYGTAVAWDTGGAIQGNIIDLNMSTADAIQWGRRTITITIL